MSIEPSTADRIAGATMIRQVVLFGSFCLVAFLKLMGLTQSSIEPVPAALSVWRPAPKVLAIAGNGDSILYPASYPRRVIVDQERSFEIPDSMVFVPAGLFTFGDGPDTRELTLDAFGIGKFAVTNGEYKEFLDETESCGCPGYWIKGGYPPGKASHPVVGISLKDAEAYAAWLGFRSGWEYSIPTAQQWEKAARGPAAYRYPWGNTADTRCDGGVLATRFRYYAVTAKSVLALGNREVMYDNPNSPFYRQKVFASQIAAYQYNKFGCLEDGILLGIGSDGSVQAWNCRETSTGLMHTDLMSQLKSEGGDTAPVGSYAEGKSAYGAYDMAGNVWNWCSSKIVARRGAEKGRLVNEIRGGSWCSPAKSCTSISTGEGRAAHCGYTNVGFRLMVRPSQR